MYLVLLWHREEDRFVCLFRVALRRSILDYLFRVVIIFDCAASKSDAAFSFIPLEVVPRI